MAILGKPNVVLGIESLARYKASILTSVPSFGLNLFGAIPALCMAYSWLCVQGLLRWCLVTFVQGKLLTPWIVSPVATFLNIN